MNSNCRGITDCLPENKQMAIRTRKLLCSLKTALPDAIVLFSSYYCTRIVRCCHRQEYGYWQMNVVIGRDSCTGGWIREIKTVAWGKTDISSNVETAIFHFAGTHLINLIYGWPRKLIKKNRDNNRAYDSKNRDHNQKFYQSKKLEKNLFWWMTFLWFFFHGLIAELNGWKTRNQFTLVAKTGRSWTFVIIPGNVYFNICHIRWYLIRVEHWFAWLLRSEERYSRCPNMWGGRHYSWREALGGSLIPRQ